MAKATVKEVTQTQRAGEIIARNTVSGTVACKVTNGCRITTRLVDLVRKNSTDLARRLTLDGVKAISSSSGKNGLPTGRHDGELFSKITLYALPA